MFLHHVTGSFLLLQLLDYSTSVAFLFLSLYILLRDWRAPLNRAFFFMLGSFFVWSFSLFMAHDPFATAESAVLFYNMASIGWATFASLSLYCALIMSRNKDLDRFKPLALIPVPIFIWLQWTGHLTGNYVLRPWGWTYNWVAPFWLLVFCLYFFVFISATFYIFYYLWQKGGTEIIRGQASILFFTGIISAVLASITDIILPINNIHFIPNMGPSCTLIFALGIIYAMTRYRFALSEKEIREEADREIREAKEYASSIVESSADAIIGKTLDGTITSWNNGARSIYGYPPGEIVGKNIRILVPKELISQIDQLLKRISAGEKIEHFETERLRKDGSRIFISLSMSPIKDAAGKIMGAATIARDITERKRMEDALAKSNSELNENREFLSITLHSIGDGIIVTDTRGMITLINTVAEKMTGWSAEEALGRHLEQVFNIVNQETRERCENPAERVLKTGRICGLGNHTILIARDGAERVLDDSGAPIIGKDGKTIGVVLIFRDVTLQRKMEREILEAKERYEDMVNNLPVGIYRNTPGPKGHFLEVNPFMISLFEADSKEQFLKINVSDLYADPSKRSEFSDKVMASGFVKEEELRLKTLKGKMLLCSVTVVMKKDGGDIYFDGMINDITERKRAEEAIRASEEKFRTLVESASDQIFMVDKDLTFISMNGAALGQLRKRLDEVIGRSVSEVFPKETSASNIANLSKVFRTGLNYSVDEELNFGGHRVHVNTSLSPVKNIEGETVAVLGVVRDISERKKLEVELRENEKKYRSLFENSQVGMYRSRIDGSAILDVNQKYCEALGYTREEIVGAAPKMVWADAEKRKPFIEQLNKNGKIVDYETELVTKSGMARTFLISATVFPEEGILEGTIHDITERKKLEEYILTFKKAIEASTDAIFITDLKGTITFVNPGFTNIYGFTPEETIGKATPRILKSGIMKQEDYEHFWKTLIDKQPVNGQLINKTKDGRLLNIEGSSNAIVDEKGRIIGFLSIQRDISDRVKMEQNILFKTTLLEAQTEASLDGILVVDENGKIISFNKRFVEMWGIPQDVIESRSDEKALGSILAKLSDPDEFLKKVKYLYEKKNEKSRDEIDLKDGRSFDRYSAPTLGTDGRYYGRVWYFRDITESKKLDRMKDEFVSMVSHELRTPLTVIQGILANLLDGIAGEFSEKQKHYLVTMNDDVSRLSRIINDILNLSKLEAGALEIHRSETDVEALAKKCADELAGLAAAKKISISVQSDGKLPPLNIDPDRIAEVFINLINNAIKFTPEGGKISVRISGTKEQGEVSVTDTGIGLAEDQIPRLFSKFFQVSRTQPKGQKGTGLGLSISRELIGLHGGKIWAKSELGKGSTFTFTLPNVPGKKAD
jgi:PAS domain S-box-containing protein